MTVLTRDAAAGCGCDTTATDSALICVDTALARIAAQVAPVAGTEPVALTRAAGRVLAAPLQARGAVPPFDNAAMDGYAVSTAALTGAGPWTLQVDGVTAAGQAPGAALRAGRIFTGAVLPDGADAVIAQERTTPGDGGRVTLHRHPAHGDNVRRKGEDMRPGQSVLPAARLIDSRAAAAAGAAGADMLQVYRPLRVAILATGDELTAPGAPGAAGDIRDAITPILTAALTAPRFALVATERGADDRAGLAAQLARLAAQADLLVTSGGLSVGDADHVTAALRDAGGQVAFAGVALKPGKPVAFGRLGGAQWLGLPGNPLAAFTTWHLFGPPLVAGLLGGAAAPVARRHVVTARALQRKPGRCELRPARLIGFDPDGREVATFADSLQSAHVAGLPGTDGLVFVPAEVDALPEGALLEFQPLCPC